VLRADALLEEPPVDVHAAADSITAETIEAANKPMNRRATWVSFSQAGRVASLVGQYSAPARARC
jgi:hypothetical protein